MQNRNYSLQMILLKWIQGSDCSTWLCCPTAALREPKWSWATVSSRRQRTSQRTVLLSNRGQWPLTLENYWIKTKTGSFFPFFQVCVFSWNSRGCHSRLHFQSLSTRFVPDEPPSIHGQWLHQLLIKINVIRTALCGSLVFTTWWYFAGTLFYQTELQCEALHPADVCVCVLQMYIRCTVNLCITTLPSHKCPSLCSHNFSSRALVGNVYTKTYTVNSGPISLLISTSAPAPSPVTTAARTSVTSQPTTANGTILCFLFVLNINSHKRNNNAMLLAVIKI